MLFYINSISSSNQVYVEISSQQSFTLDKTLDNVKIVLECNTTKNPYAPAQKFIVLTDDNQEIDYYIANDSVELYSNTPLRYKHTLTLTQNTRALSKRVLRNTVFTQPATMEKRMYYSISNYEDADGYYQSYPFAEGHGKWIEPLILGEHEKVRRVYLVIKGTGVGMTYEPDTPSIINYNSTTNFLYNPTKFTFTYTDKNGTVRTTNFYLGDNLVCGEKIYESSYIDPARPSINFTSYFKTLTNGGSLDVDVTSLGQSFGNPAKSTYTGKDVICMNLQLEFFVETYIYTAYDVLDTLIKQLRHKHSGGQLADIFTLPSSGDLYDLLTTTIAPNFAFTQSTVFDAIAEVFNLFDATLTLNENNVLGIEYLNERNKQQIADNIFTGVNQAHAETNYNNSLISFYQDARTEELYPSEKGFAGIRFSELGIPNNANTRELATPHKIDYINRMSSIVKKFVIYNKHETGHSATFTNQPLLVDLTHFIVESSISGSLPVTNDFPYPSYSYISQLTTSNTITYTKGSNTINMGGYVKDWLGFTGFIIYNVLACGFYRYWGFRSNAIVTGALEYVSYHETYINTDWNSLRFNVDYLTSVDGVTKVVSLDNKYEGEEIINQVNGAVDLTKLGLNMLGLSLKLGQPTLAMTHQISNWNNRIQKGQLYFKDNEYWVANICTYTNLGNGYYLGNIEFSKNFNALSQRITLNKEKRFTNISANLVCKAEEILTEYVYYTSQQPTTYTGESLCMSTTYIKNYVTSSLGNSYFPTLICDATIENPDGDEIIIPLHKYCAGDTFNFEIAYQDPISAGNRTQWKTVNGVNCYYTAPVLYADNEGFLDKTTIKIGNVNSQDLGFGVYPVQDINQVVIRIEDYEFYKKPNEIFAFNYQLAFLPLNDRIHIDFIGQEFMKNSSLLYNRENQGNRKFYFSYKTSNFQYSILDTKAEYDVKIKVLTTQSTLTNNIISIIFTLEGDMPSSAVAWAITDSDDNIYFASNQPITATDTIYLYFIPKKNRI